MGTPGSSEDQDPRVIDFHKRAGESHAEVRKLLTTLATAGVGLFYGTFASEKWPLLDPEGKATVLFILLAMALAVGLGIIGWKADARWAYNVAEDFRLHPSNEKPVRGLAHWIKWVCDYIQIFAFAGAIVGILCLMYSRMSP